MLGTGMTLLRLLSNSILARLSHCRTALQPQERLQQNTEIAHARYLYSGAQTDRPMTSRRTWSQSHGIEGGLTGQKFQRQRFSMSFLEHGGKSEMIQNPSLNHGICPGHHCFFFLFASSILQSILSYVLFWCPVLSTCSCSAYVCSCRQHVPARVCCVR